MRLAQTIDLLFAVTGDCHWVTIEHEHICIRNGKITKGPKDLIGKPPGAVAKKHAEEGQKSSDKKVTTHQQLNSKLISAISKLPEIGSASDIVHGITELPGGKLLVKAIKDFTDEYSEEIQEAADTYVKKGGCGNKIGCSEAQAIVNAIRGAKETDGVRYRGLGWSHLFAKDMKVGDTVDVTGPRSFSYSKGIATGDFGGRMLLVLEGKAKGLNAASMSTHRSEQEFMTMGKFKITGIQDTKNNNGLKVKVFHIKQVGVF